jgi:hypothetical protein
VRERGIAEKERHIIWWRVNMENIFLRNLLWRGSLLQG